MGVEKVLRQLQMHRCCNQSKDCIFERQEGYCNSYLLSFDVSHVVGLFMPSLGSITQEFAITCGLKNGTVLPMD